MKPKTVAAAIVLAAFAILAALYLTACAAHPSGRETSPLGAHLQAAEGANAAATSEAKTVNELGRATLAAAAALGRHTDAALSDAAVIDHKAGVLLRDSRRRSRP